MPALTLWSVVHSQLSIDVIARNTCSSRFVGLTSRGEESLPCVKYTLTLVLPEWDEGFDKCYDAHAGTVGCTFSEFPYQAFEEGGARDRILFFLVVRKHLVCTG